MTTSTSGQPSLPPPGDALRPTPPFCTVDEAADLLRAGRLLLVVDDENRENEGDLVAAAQFATPEIINFMVTAGRGLVCVPLDAALVTALDLPRMAPPDERDALRTAFTVSVDARAGTSTGISAADRATTIRALADPASRPDDFTRPGHIFPLRAVPGGVLRRTGHTEASVDLCRIAGLRPAAVICEIMNADGTMARLPDLVRFARAHDLRILTVAAIVAYRRAREKTVEPGPSARLPTAFGDFDLHLYRDLVTGADHVALVHGDPAADAADPSRPAPLVRVHSECMTGDVFGSLRCDCGQQLHAAMQTVAAAPSGAILYMRQEGRGIGLAEKIRAYALQEQGLDTVEANLRLGYPPDLRDYGGGAQILLDLGITRLRLLTNNPRKIAGLEGYGLQIVERVPLAFPPNPHDAAYLRTKHDKLGQLL